MAINEATLEARIHKVLDTVFPTFRELNIEHQKHFSISLGHHDVTVDHEAPPSRPVQAKLDILLKSGDQNLILLELKREGLALDDDDRDQGLSYARLIHQMPPLVLISNGHQNQFYNTYTTEKLPRDSVDLDLIQAMVDNSFSIAMNEFKKAVNILLNKQPELFSKVITSISNNRFNQYCGPVKNLFKPICPEFQLPRKIVAESYMAFENGDNLVGLIGSAFSGKTNALYQFYKTYSQKEQHYIFYLDALDVQYSIFQQLATQFSKETKVAITKDRIREWFNNSLYDDSGAKFFLLIDNFNKELPDEIKAEVFELMDMFSGSTHGILYSIDEFSYKELATVSNRQYSTVIGDKSTLISLAELDIEEYDAAINVLYQVCHAIIEHGGQYATEYRLPRVLRQLAAFYIQVDFEEGQGTKIQAVPDLEFLKLFSSSKIYGDDIQKLYKVIAAAFLLEGSIRKAVPILNIAAVSNGAISVFTMEKSFLKDYRKILRLGLAIKRSYGANLAVIIPKIPELMAFHSIGVIAHYIGDMIRRNENSDAILSFLLINTKFVPYGDLIAIGVLQEVSAISAEIFSELVNKLIESEPIQDNITPGADVLLFDENAGPIEYHIPEDLAEAGDSFDPFAWSVISQLAGYPMELLDHDHLHPLAFNFYLLRTIGSWNDFIPRSDFHSLSNLPACGFHKAGEQGRYVCEKSGIVEPIVQSIQKFFLTIGSDFDFLIERAFEDESTFLLWRIYLAIADMETIVDPELAERAGKFIKRFQKEYRHLFCDLG
jgi:hypothetical protein